jgi:hypothetical protein
MAINIRKTTMAITLGKRKRNKFIIITQPIYIVPSNYQKKKGSWGAYLKLAKKKIRRYKITHAFTCAKNPPSPTFQHL